MFCHYNSNQSPESQFSKCSQYQKYTQEALGRTRVRVALRMAVSRQSVCLGAKPLETHDHNFFQLSTCGYSPYVTSPLTRGWVCCLQLLWSFWGLNLAGLMTIFYCLRLDSPNLEGQVPIFISSRNRLAQLYP
jgi:hypothetical protein